MPRRVTATRNGDGSSAPPWTIPVGRGAQGRRGGGVRRGAGVRRGSQTCGKVGRGEGGKVMVLVPASVLVLAILGAISVDSGAGFLAQRQLAQAAQSAAEDATGQVATSGFYQTGAVALDPSRAAQVARASVAAQSLSGVKLQAPIRVQVQGAQVCVSLVGRAPVVFGAALPGVPRWITVSAHSTATAAGYLGPRVPARALC